MGGRGMTQVGGAGAGAGRRGWTWDLFPSESYHDLFKYLLLHSKPLIIHWLKTTAIYGFPGFCGPGTCRAQLGGSSGSLPTTDASVLLRMTSPPPRALSSSSAWPELPSSMAGGLRALRSTSSQASRKVRPGAVSSSLLLPPVGSNR